MTAPVVAWPKLVIPANAVPAWRALTASLEDREPPCSSDPSMWFSTRPDETEAAAHRCRTCHAFTPCDEYATAAHESLGVWAGRDRTKQSPSEVVS